MPAFYLSRKRDATGSFRQRIDLHLPRHVRGGEPAAIGRDRNRADPVLELAAAALAQVAHELAVFEPPDLDERIAARGEDVLAVGMKREIGRAIEMAGRGLAPLLASRGIQKRDLAGEAICLAA